MPRWTCDLCQVELEGGRNHREGRVCRSWRKAREEGWRELERGVTSLPEKLAKRAWVQVRFVFNRKFLPEHVVIAAALADKDAWSAFGRCHDGLDDAGAEDREIERWSRIFDAGEDAVRAEVAARALVDAAWAS